MFSEGKSERESESSGPTFGTGNEKRRSLRKSRLRSVCRMSIFMERALEIAKNHRQRDGGSNESSTKQTMYTLVA